MNERGYHWALAAWIVLAPPLAVPHATAAEPPPRTPSAADRAEAKRLFDEGRAAFRQGDYRRAIEQWRASLALSGEPLIHYNIGNAHERRGDLEEAVVHFEAWLEHAPEGEKPDLEARIARLKKRLAARPEPEPEPAPATIRVRPGGEVRRRPAPSEPPPAEPTPTPWPTLGWVTLSVGGAATVAGVALAITAGVTRPDAEEACLDAGLVLCRAEEGDAIRQSNLFATVGDGLWIGGAALTAAGLAVVLFAPAETIAETGWTLEATPTGARATLTF